MKGGLPNDDPKGAKAWFETVSYGKCFGPMQADFVTSSGPTLTPLQMSSGGRERLGRITKMGDKYLRKLLIVGMTSLVRRAKYKPESVDPRLADLLARKPVRVATVAMANKAARVIWAIMTCGETCRSGHMPVLAA